MGKHLFYVAIFIIAVRILVTAVNNPKAVIMPGKVQAAIYDADHNGTADFVVKKDSTAVRMNKMYIKTKPTPQEQQYFLTHK